MSLVLGVIGPTFGHVYVLVGQRTCCWKPRESSKSKNFLASRSSEESLWMLKSPTIRKCSLESITDSI